MSNKENTQFIESLKEEFDAFLEDQDYEHCLALVKEANENGFRDESLELANAVLLAQREDADFDPRDITDRMGTNPY